MQLQAEHKHLVPRLVGTRLIIEIPGTPPCYHTTTKRRAMHLMISSQILPIKDSSLKIFGEFRYFLKILNFKFDLKLKL